MMKYLGDDAKQDNTVLWGEEGDDSDAESFHTCIDQEEQYDSCNSEAEDEEM